MKDEILAGLSQFDLPEPEWCLPPRFWSRAAPFFAYTVFPLGWRVDLPIRKCHFSAIRVFREGAKIEESDLSIATGYAYTEGKWFRHSWVVNQPDYTLLECTPIEFDKYFGVVLTKLESQQFAEIIGYDKKWSKHIIRKLGKLPFITT